MPTLVVENVPVDVYERLRRRALAQHRSLPEETLHLLELALRDAVSPAPRLPDLIPSEEISAPCDLPRSSEPVPTRAHRGQPRLPDAPPDEQAAKSEASGVSPGILRSQQAFWRDLPELLKNGKNLGKTVCYHKDERIGIADREEALIRECLRRKIPDSEYDLFTIKPHDVPPWEPEEVEALGPWHFEDPGEHESP